MSALSPRGSFSGHSSDEVAEDFKDSLGDLAYNNKWEIQNLTMIAKESTEHAQAISKVLETHIKTTPPERKLPALYLLDSIIKNVGTPYTVYLGRNLYSTFMEMYGLVDAQTRRSMEAVLKTWKDPIAESTDRRPVLPLDLVKPIENALLKAKAALMKHQQPPAGFARNTATPPVNGMHGQQYPHQQQPAFYPPMQQGRPSSQSGFQTSYQTPQVPPPPSIDDVKRDLHFVLQAAQQEAQRNPYDPSITGRVRALQDLNMVLFTHQCSPADLQAIAAEVREQQQRLFRPAQLPSQPQWQQQQQVPFPPPQPTPQLPGNPYGMPPSAQPPVSIPPAQLSSLAALFNNGPGPKPSTPQMRNVAPALQSLPPAQVSAIQSQAAAAPPTNGADLLAALSKAGIIKSSQQPSVMPPPMPTQPGLADLLHSLNKSASHAGGHRTTIDLTTTASLDMFRPELVRKLYPVQSNPCPQCGRRFPTTVEGRKKKDMHLDWHFRVNQRISTSAMGRLRDWFTNDIEWTKRREFDESTADAAASQEAAAAANNAQKPKDPKQSYVRAPAGVTQMTCNICYEDMRSSFPAEIGDWVFVNAAVNNGKIVHASCLAELQGSTTSTAAPTHAMPAKQTQATSQQASLAAALAALSGGNTRESTRTPDSSLGKRKAEEEAGGPGKVLKGS